jgi:2-C-methyl-D-erythritol 4-phosphate cytidylyltransferase
MNIALLTAAGRGSRMNLDIPKQFLHIDGKPIIIHTMEVFQKHPMVDAMIVVTLAAWIEPLKTYAKEYGITKLMWTAVGGSTGQESIYLGLKELEKDCQATDIIIVHDGNRPLVSDEIISDSLVICREYGSAVAAMPCVEAIFQSEDGRSSNVSIPREQLFRTQTPHSYTLEKLLWAHKKAKELKIENTTATCVLMQLLGESIHFSKGSDMNLKLTTQEDLELYKAVRMIQ